MQLTRNVERSISIHALLAESDPAQAAHPKRQRLFLSTLSLRRATALEMVATMQQKEISIHALLAESDYLRLYFKHPNVEFLSTLSLRRATADATTTSTPAAHFYPRSPCGERLPPGSTPGRTAKISIHALLAESDKGGYNVSIDDFVFLSTLSLRRATRRERGPGIPDFDFYPRSPCGERLKNAITAAPQQEFLSTLSLRRATAPQQENGQAATISIHALLAESDTARAAAGCALSYFYPRSPCGERRTKTP